MLSAVGGCPFFLHYSFFAFATDVAAAFMELFIPAYTSFVAHIHTINLMQSNPANSITTPIAVRRAKYIYFALY